MNTLELTGWQLDYFTGLAMRHEMCVSNDGAGPAYLDGLPGRPFAPTEWPEDLMPVLLKMATVLRAWHARAVDCSEFARGDTLPVAVCRALVLATYGPTVPDLVGYKNDSAPDACEDLFA